MHVAIQERKEMVVDPGRKAQIKAQNGVPIGALLFDKALTEVSAKYSDYSNVFLADNPAELSENTRMNKHAIKLEEDKQPSFGLIYSLGLVKLETLKTYIKTNLVNDFIQPFKSPIKASIFFDRKPDGSFRLCVDYWGLNNIMIKNQYPLPLIRESLNQLGWARQFTQVDLINTYHRMRICEGDIWKTTFRTWYGYFEYQVMSFGLSNTLATF